MRRPTPARAAALLSLALAGCPGGDEPEDLGPPPDCSKLSAALEVLDPAGQWQSTSPEADAELVLGFQGFKMMYARVRVTVVPPVRSGSIVLRVGEGAPASQTFAPLSFQPTSGGAVSEPFPLFFNNETLAELAGRDVALQLRIGKPPCQAAADGRATLVYRPGCLQVLDGALACDGGASP